MPKRSNEYQKLILAINNHFSSGTSKVTESAMLYDPKSEQDREIDILIEEEVSGFTLNIGIECTAVKRPLTVEKLVGLADKHRDCGINKTVIVSKSGFAKTTIKKAKDMNVELISYEAALEKDWPEEFTDLAKIIPYHKYCEVLPELSLTYTEGSCLDGFEAQEDPLVLEYKLRLTKFLLFLLEEETEGAMLPPIFSHEHAEKEGITFSKKWFFEPPITLRAKSGSKVKVIRMEPSYFYKRTKLIGDFKAGKYNDKLVATSVLQNAGMFQESRITISKEQSCKDKGGMKVSISLDSQ